MEFSEKIRNARIAKSMSQKELAEEMGVSGNACQKRITRAKLHLRKALEETGPPGSEDPLTPDSMTTERRRERP